MKVFFKPLIFVLIFLCINPLLKAQDSQASVSNLEASLLFGYTADNLSWSIAGNLNGQNPNIYSELIWKNLRGPLTQFNFKYRWKSFIIVSDLTYALILAGSATDSDYEEDNRTARIFFAELNSDKGKLYSINPAVGYRFDLGKKMYVIPVAGFGINGQKLYLMDDQDLNSSYKTTWQGPFAGLKSNVNISNKINIQIGLTYHQVNYKAQGDWNLVESFMHPVSFKHTAKGYGVETDLNIGYAITSSLKIYISSEYHSWSTGAGIDELFFADGNKAKTRLNDVTRQGYSTGLGITYLIN
jgi:outer membrane protease